MTLELFDTKTCVDRPARSRHDDPAVMALMPRDHVGPVTLPGSGRLVYWTGRVAIGLRHQPTHRQPARGGGHAGGVAFEMSPTFAARVLPFDAAIH